MNTRKLALMTGLLALGTAMLVSPGVKAQPLDDKVIVDMPYTTTIGHKTLPPGEYVIKRLPNSSGSRILLFYSDNGMKFETSAMTIPVYDPNVARDSKVILSRVGDDYYYDKVWVQGKSYGYEFVLPKEVRMRIKELARITVPGSSTSTITASTTTTTTSSQEIAAAEVEQPVVQQEVETKVEERTEIAQAEPVVEPAPEPLPESADRAMDEAPAPTTAAREEMPHTATTWMAMLLAGATLLGAGMMVSRRA
jgi:hypothetical protein